MTDRGRENESERKEGKQKEKQRDEYKWMQKS
jgi:hypothetical protein